MEFTVKTPVFEGPLDLLLDLVEKRKLFIGEISLSEVTDDYISYVRDLPEFHLGNRTVFLVIAATLILIKSRALLPNINLSEEEAGEIVDLEERLRLYKIFKEASLGIKNIFGDKIIFEKTETKNFEPIFSPSKSINLDEMNSIIKRVLSLVPKKENLTEVDVKKIVSLEEMMDNFSDRIQSALTMNFKDFSSGSPYQHGTKEHKVFVIVGFLAILELVRKGFMDALQENGLGDILLEKSSPDLEIAENLENMA